MAPSEVLNLHNMAGAMQPHCWTSWHLPHMERAPTYMKAMIHDTLLFGLLSSSLLRHTQHLPGLQGRETHRWHCI